MIDKPTQNKMMTRAPAKKEYHFPATTDHHAEVVYAGDIREAEAIYHNVKRLIKPLSTSSDSKATEDVQ